MTPRLACQFARYVDGMRVYCDKVKGFCGNVFFKACRGKYEIFPFSELLLFSPVSVLRDILTKRVMICKSVQGVL